MTINDDLIQADCEQCGRPRTKSAEILSRHTTSAGVVTYTHCACGLLEAWLCPTADGRTTLVAQGRPDDASAGARTGLVRG